MPWNIYVKLLKTLKKQKNSTNVQEKQWKTAGTPAAEKFLVFTVYITPYIFKQNYNLLNIKWTSKVEICLFCNFTRADSKPQKHVKPKCIWEPFAQKNIAAIAFISYIKADKDPEPYVSKRKMLSLDECDITATTIHQPNKK